jgi:hypothetical protein
MKNLIYRYLGILLLNIIGFTALTQNSYTPYDYFPGIIRDYKPAYETNYPGSGAGL